MSRPFGIVIISAIAILFAAILLFIIPFLLRSYPRDSFTIIGVTISTILLLVGVYGFWTYQAWGRKTLLTAFVCIAIYDNYTIVDGIINGDFSNVSAITLFSVVVEIGVISTLLLGKKKGYFESKSCSGIQEC